MLERKIAVIGLGYVGLTTAIEFAKMTPVIGYDVDQERVLELQQHKDFNQEIAANELSNSKIKYTSQIQDVKSCDFFIMALPTPLNAKLEPDLSTLVNTSTVIGTFLKEGDIVVYESSVYPGATEEECIPALERSSKLTAGKDFGVVYSPERVNPGDTVHTFVNIKKIVAATDQNTLNIASQVYSAVIKAGIYLAPNIKTAEATKLVENIQRDINVAYLNEVAMLMHHMGLNTTEVLKAMSTKWNALNFKPGLVGGHCIGVNAHYLAYKAQHIKAETSLINDARKINEQMPTYLVNITAQNLDNMNIDIRKAKIGIFGFTFKENCADLKDTLVIKIINELRAKGATILTYDPIASPETAIDKYNIELYTLEQMQGFQAIIIAVAHNGFLNKEQDFMARIDNRGLIVDIKGILNPQAFDSSKIKLWQI